MFTKNRKGFTLVEIMIVVAIIALLAAVAIPSLLRSRIQANESAAISACKSIATAQTSFLTSTASFGDNLDDLSGATPPYIDGRFAADGSSVQGYTFTIVSGDATTFHCNAIPQVAATSGVRSFCVTDDGVVRVQLLGGAIADRAACRALGPV